MATKKEANRYLCEDVLLNILGRISEKNLIRCKCVSKEWHRIISHVCVPRLSIEAPVSGIYFRLVLLSDLAREVYTNSSKECIRMLVNEVQGRYANHIIDCAPLELFPEPIGSKASDGSIWFPGMTYESLLPFRHRGTDFLDCCNGLLLFVQHLQPQYYVCNPYTRQCVPVPLPEPSLYFPTVYASLAFDPAESIDYRLVNFSLTTQPQCLHVFYSQSGKWVTHELQLELPAPAHCFQLVRHSVYLNGTLYRISKSNKIVRVDLNALKACIINCPSGITPPDQYGCLGVLNGGISYAMKDDVYIRVWLLDYPSVPQWTLKYSIPLDFLVKEFDKVDFACMLVWLRPCGFHPKANIIFVGGARQIATYHLESRRFNTVIKRKHYGAAHAGRFIPISTYSNTLVTLKNWRGVTA